MARLLIKLLGEARGNAVWSAIVKICQWGWPFVLSALTWLAGWFKHAPMWQVWNKKGDKNPKHKTKEEQISESVEEIAKRNFPERFQPDEADNPIAKKQFAKKMLGVELRELQEHLNNAMNTSRFVFKGDLKEKEWQTTKALFASTESLLKTLLTEAEASLFSVATPAPIKEISDDPYFSESRMDWQWHVNYIIVKRDELKKIIERLG